MSKHLYQEPMVGEGEGGFSDSVQAHMNDSIARIEALKARILFNEAIALDERDAMISELNTIRADYLHFGSLARTPRVPRAPETTVSATPGESSELELIGILGQNPGITQNLKKIGRLAPTTLPVLLEGETGAGKDLFARIIHLNSGRKKFIAINCGALPADIIESELFGHVRGAFTGAVSNRKGKLEEAAGGTIFLDEIGDLQQSAQVKLLRVLDQGEIQRVGSDTAFHTDARVITATNQDLENMVREGTFREDLFYRLNACHLFIPPLRERRDEIELLFEWFVKQTCADLNKPLPRLESKVRDFLFNRYPYPGNIRELKNIAVYISHISQGGPVGAADLPDRYVREFERDVQAETIASPEATRQHIRDSAEHTYLSNLVHTHGGNIPEICRELGLSRSRVYQLLKKHGIRPTEFKGRRQGG